MQREVVAVPGDELCRIPNGIRERPGAEIEFAHPHSVHKSHFRGHDVPGQIQRASRDCRRAIVALIQGNCRDDAFRNAVLVLERWQKNIMKEEASLIGLHGYRIAARNL